MSHQATIQQTSTLPKNYLQKKGPEICMNDFNAVNRMGLSIRRKILKGMGTIEEIEIKKSGPVDYETLMRYKKEFGIEDPDHACEVLGFYPNKDTVIPFDFKAFNSDIEAKKEKLRLL